LMRWRRSCRSFNRINRQVKTSLPCWRRGFLLCRKYINL